MVSSGDVDDLCNQIRSVKGSVSGHVRKRIHLKLRMDPKATDVHLKGSNFT